MVEISFLREVLLAVMTVGCHLLAVMTVGCHLCIGFLSSISLQERSLRYFCGRVSTYTQEDLIIVEGELIIHRRAYLRIQRLAKS